MKKGGEIDMRFSEIPDLLGLAAYLLVVDASHAEERLLTALRDSNAADET